MPGLITTQGSMHTCPMCSGTTPHVGGPVVQTAAPGVTLNGKSIALMGDSCTCAGPPDLIAQGEAGVTVNGMPVATVGCMTAHGGTITEGEPGASIQSSQQAPTTTLPESKIPFPKITIKDRLFGDVTEAEENRQQLREAAAEQEDNEEQDKREVALQSRYPLDELTEYANQFGASFFNHAMQAIFGDANEKKGQEIPMHAYEHLYRDLSDGKVSMPPLKVDPAAWKYGSYNHKENVIYISRPLIIRATEQQDPKAMGTLYQALMEEFGHFIDWQLRTTYTRSGGEDAPLDEGAVFGYCLTTLNVFEDTSLDFGEATVDGTTYALSIDLSELQQQIDELVSRERTKRDRQDPDEEYFGAGKRTVEEAGGYTHYGVEEVLESEGILDGKDLNFVYLGNLLCDWSQLISPMIERYTEAEKQEIADVLELDTEKKKKTFGLTFDNPMRLSRETLSFVIELIAAHEMMSDDLEVARVGGGTGNSIADKMTSPAEAAESAGTPPAPP